MAHITLDAIGDAVLVVDPQGQVIYLNKVAETLTGWPSEQALGQQVEMVFSIFDGSTRERVTSPGQRAIDEGRTVGLALGSVLVRRDGTDMAIEDSAAPIYNRYGKVAGAVIVFHDARQSVAAMEEMSHLSQHDILTGLPNRILLRERLTQAIGMAHRHGNNMAVMFLDLDHFKPINDAYGHAVGDQLLRDAASEITACLRTTDTVSRHGGDEFLILLSEIKARTDAVQIARKILDRFAQPRVLDGHDVQVSLSIGISVFPEDGQDPDTLIHNADTAMYASKQKGRNQFQFCDPMQQSGSAPPDSE
ncbi:diguanylate cyclase domain-containing protein [Saccharospirillum salsuginis]|nr:diguanylate cyclase [Saccharospirillum salsuginis]